MWYSSSSVKYLKILLLPKFKAGQNLPAFQQQQQSKNTDMWLFYTTVWELVTSVKKLGVVSTGFSGGEKNIKSIQSTIVCNKAT